MKRKKTNIKKRIKKKIELSNNKNDVGSTAEDRLRKRTEVSLVKPKKDKKFAIFSEKYSPINVVDFDAVIIISSYNRYEKVNRLLNQLFTQETSFKIKIIVLNDGSTNDNYNKLVDIYPEIDYIYNEVNNGKEKYWKTITKLFTEASKYMTHVVIQIDDDFILCDKFIDILLKEFFKNKKINNRYVSFYYHSPNIKDYRWGIRNWFDGGVAFDSQFLNLIGNKVNSISNNRWNLNKNLSSGVWRQLSSIVDSNGLLTYRFNKSLVKHDGNFDSKMNTEQRKNKPIFTKNYIND